MTPIGFRPATRIDSELEDALRHDERGTKIINTLDVRPNLRNAVWEAHNRNHLIGPVLRTGIAVVIGG